MLTRYGLSIGLARNASSSAYPNLWRGLVGLWVPSAGKQGTGIADLSGRGNYAAFISAPTAAYSPGRTGWAWVANTAIGTCLHGKDLSGASKFTIMGWARQNAIDVVAGLFTKLGSAAATDSIFVETYNDGQLYFEINNGANTYANFDYSTAVTAGKWFHWACVFDGSGATNAEKAKIYIDGKPITTAFGGTLPTTAPTNAGIYELGFYRGTPTGNWNGLIDDLRLYTRALSPGEIRLSMFASPLTLRKRSFIGKAGVAVAGQPTMRRWGGVPTMLGGQPLGRTW